MKRFPEIFVLIGLPGCGKTTWTKKHMEKNPGTVHVSSDRIVEEIAANTGKTYNEVWPSNVKAATERAMEDLINAVNDRKDVIIDRTNLTVKSRAPYVKIAKDAGYHVSAIRFDTPVDICLERQNNPDRAGKVIPKEAFAAMLRNLVSPENNTDNLMKEFDIVGNVIPWP